MDRPTRLKKQSSQFNRLTITYLLSHLSVIVYSVSIIFGGGILLAQLTYFLGIINLDNWIYLAVGVAVYISLALVIALALKFSKHAGKFELRGNFVRLAGVLIVFVNRSYYLNYEFPSDPVFVALPFALLIVSLIFFLIHVGIKSHYYNICLGRNPKDIELFDLSVLETQDERNKAVVHAHRETIHPKYKQLLDVYNIIHRKNGITNEDEYAIFYGMQINLLGWNRIVPLFKTIIILEN